MIASVKGVSRSFGDQEVLKDITAQIHEGDRVGLIGPNGAGKSTLLSLLTREQEPEEGELYVNPDSRVGYLRQNGALEGSDTVMDAMRSVFASALEAQARMASLTEQIERNPEDRSLQRAYDAAMSQFLADDGFNMDVNIRRVLNGMGFGEESEEKLVDDMSGGERTRLALARLLLQGPDLLVLDEPTNHLDMETLGWLEEYLRAYKGAILVVSHDRFFLDRVATSIWEIEDGRLETYKGDYTKSRITKKERVKGLLKEYEKQQNQIAAMEEYVRRNAVRASTAQLAKSREKRLEKMERVEKPRTRSETPRFSFSSGRRPVSEVLNVSRLDLEVGEERKRIVTGLDLQVKRGDRVAVIGANGAGKTTFLRALARNAGREEGKIAWGKNVAIGYYDQENKDLDPGLSVLGALMDRRPQLTEHDARSLLASVLLRGEEVFKSVADLSGGERAKVGLAALMAQDANVLLLDEPTNHLDLEAREALEEALGAYDGTLIFVSHDRYFINALADRVLSIEKGRGTCAEGDYDAFLESRKAAAASPEKTAARPRSKSASQKELRRLQALGRQALREAETRMEEIEGEMEDLKKYIAENASEYEALQEACERLESLGEEYDRAMERWVEADESLKELS